MEENNGPSRGKTDVERPVIMVGDVIHEEESNAMHSFESAWDFCYDCIICSYVLDIETRTFCWICIVCEFASAAH